MMTYSVPMAQQYSQTQRGGNQARELFNIAFAAGQRRRFWGELFQRRTGLRTLKQATPAGGGRAVGLRLVALADIRGTEGRAGDFDDQFHPLTTTTRQRWQSVANAVAAGLVLTPVQLIRVGGEYFVRDGHHRVSVARAMGQESIEAEVVVWEGA